MRRCDIDTRGWFELAHHLDPTTRKMVRFYEITCRECKRFTSYHANGLSDDGLRKFFMRHGWSLGRRKNQHLCPECSKHSEKPEPIVSVEIAAPTKVPPETPTAPSPSKYNCSFCFESYELGALYKGTAKNSRSLICLECISLAIGEINAPPRPKPENLWCDIQNADVLNADALKDAERMMRLFGGQPPQSEAPADQDDEPADWWKELNEGASRH